MSRVLNVSKSPIHGFNKQNASSIKLIEGIGVEGDVHAGKTVQHTFLVKKDSSKANIRQVHLIAAELLSELNDKGFDVKPGELGENITTTGIDLLSLPTGTQLTLGEHALIQLTALRNPCVQVDNFKPGLLKHVVYKNAEGEIIRRLGVMAIVLNGGVVKPDDAIDITLPAEPHQPLKYIW